MKCIKERNHTLFFYVLKIISEIIKPRALTFCVLKHQTPNTVRSFLPSPSDEYYDRICPLKCEYWKHAPPLPCCGDWICCNNPSGFCSRQFVKPQRLFQHTGKSGTIEVHSIISPWVVDSFIMLFCSVFQENVLFPAFMFFLLQRPPDSKPEHLLNLSHPSLFRFLIFFEVLSAFCGPFKPACFNRELFHCSNHYMPFKARITWKEWLFASC